MDALRKSIGEDAPEAAPEAKKKPAKGIALVKSDKTPKPKVAAKAARTPKRRSA
jgi:hypothetical protein